MGLHLFVGKSQHPEARLLQVSRSLSVGGPLFRIQPATSVNFDDQPGARTVKICEVGAERMLPSKRASAESAGTQVHPEDAFLTAGPSGRVRPLHGIGAVHF